MSDSGYIRESPRALFIILFIVSAGYGANLDLEAIFRQGIPSSPFMNVVYRYADTMLEKGRDTYGPQKSGLFLSALDRKTLSILENRPGAPSGIRESDRPGAASGPLVGANPQLDQNLLRLLYFLTEMSGENRYQKAADNELEWFLKNTQSPTTGLLPWGEHLCWNTVTDEVASAHSEPVHEFARPWMLWDRCFKLAPEQSKKFALGLWNSQIADHKTGAFDRHANFYLSSPHVGMDFPRHAGFYIRTWAEAYTHTDDPIFLEAISILLRRFEKKRHPVTGLIPAESGSAKASPPDVRRASPALSLSLAIDCDSAARKVPEPLSQRLRTFADREDQAFCSLPHDMNNKKGFVTSVDLATGKPGGTYTSAWDAGYGAYTTAAVAMMCVSRYENTGKVGYRDLIVEAADVYLNSLPDGQIDAWPMTFGHAIGLELAAFRETAQARYHKQAFRLAEIAVEKFFGDNPLPRASLKTDHYESITGADTLLLALVELHLTTLHITAVRAPANSVDR